MVFPVANSPVCPIGQSIFDAWSHFSSLQIRQFPPQVDQVHAQRATVCRTRAPLWQLPRSWTLGTKSGWTLDHGWGNSISLGTLQGHCHQDLQTNVIRWTLLQFALQEATPQSMRAATEIQPKKGLQPMVSEFKSILKHPFFLLAAPIAFRRVALTFVYRHVLRLIRGLAGIRSTTGNLSALPRATLYQLGHGLT